jgi:MFS family permease
MPRGNRRGLSSFFGVGGVGLLTYIGEYASYIVVLAFLSDKLTVSFGLGTSGYALIGTISGAYLVLSGLAAIPIGHLSDKYGRRRLTIIGCLLGAGALLSLTVIDQIPDLAVFSIGMAAALTALGSAHGVFTASTLAYTGDLAEREGGMGKPFGLIEGAEFAGYAFGPAFGTTIGYYLGTRTGVFETSAYMMLAAAAIAFFFMPEMVRVSTEAVASHLRSEEKTGRDAIVEDLPGEVGDIHVHSVSWSDFLAAFKLPIIGVALLTTFVGSIGFSGFFYYVPLYANALRFSIPIFALLYGYFASIMAATAVILMVPLGAVEDKGERRMPYLVAGLVVGALSLGFVFFFSPAVITFAIASLAFGGSIAMVRVSQLVILAENSSTSNRAAIMGTNHAVEHAGYGVASVIIGAAIGGFGFIRGFQALSLVLAAAGIAFYIYARRKNVG